MDSLGSKISGERGLRISNAIYKDTDLGWKEAEEACPGDGILVRLLTEFPPIIITDGEMKTLMEKVIDAS